ncbi:MAG TPA: phage holin family protein [Anaeromyxobacteraceae bacterium]|nr:phage holin family protein [Anaeromyxobacteraceae bacterium]
MADASRTAPYPWRFHRVGGLDQVRLDRAEDLRNLDRLDQKLWVALACPVNGLELDAATLALLDSDNDGRVRAPEVIAAVRFADARLKDLGDIVQGKADLPLSAIREDTPEGRALLAAARQLLAAAGKPEASEVTIEDVADLSHAFEKTLFNGDGVIIPESAAEGPGRQVVVDAMSCVGEVVDRSGKPGLDRAHLEAFFAELADFDAWWKAGRVPEVQVLGDATPAAADAVRAVRAKVDDYFTRTGLAALDDRMPPLLARPEAEIAAMAGKDLSPGSAEVSSLPIARIAPGRPLPLGEGVNPAWAGVVTALQRDAVAKVLGAGQPSLSGADWEALKARFAPYEAWLATRKGSKVEKLGAARVGEILAGTGRADVEALLAQDEARKDEAAEVVELARMVRYRRDLFRLLRNFVNFADFYDPRMPAVFQAGTLYVDGRACHLCVKVDNPAAHATVAAASQMYLAYCDCRRAGGATMKIVACVTQGDSTYLATGRNGIFYDRSGKDWDATITKIVENPISLRQAFWSPYRRLVKAINEQAARFAAAKDKESQAQMTQVAEKTAGAATAAKAPAPAPVDVGKMVGIIAALGVGVGALGTIFGAAVSGFIGLQPWWAKLIAIAGILLAISGPAVLVAWLKLRERTLGPVLDGTGWAVNGRVAINMPLGTVLTDRAVLPPGSSRSLQDPFVDAAARRRRVIAWLVVVAVAVALGVARWQHLWPFRKLG